MAAHQLHLVLQVLLLHTQVVVVVVPFGQHHPTLVLEVAAVLELVALERLAVCLLQLILDQVVEVLAQDLAHHQIMAAAAVLVL
jgi:hypothetical protein